MGKKKRHHYLSEFYLKGFVCPHNPPTIWIYTKGDNKIIDSNPNDVAVKKHYFTFQTEDGVRDSEAVENTLMEMEDKIAPVLKKIIEEQSITEEERTYMASLLALNYVRSPNQKVSIQNAMGQMAKHLMRFTAAHEEGFESMIARFEKATGKSISMPIEDFRRVCIDEDDNYKYEGDSQASLAMSLKFSLELSKIFFRMKWIFIKSNENFRFLTSDNPLYWRNPEHNPNSFYSGHGLANKKIEVTMPLSRDFALFASWETGRDDCVYLNGDNNLIKSINRRTALSALKFVYASEKSEGINRMVQKFINSSPRLTSR